MRLISILQRIVSIGGIDICYSVNTMSRYTLAACCTHDANTFSIDKVEMCSEEQVNANLKNLLFVVGLAKWFAKQRWPQVLHLPVEHVVEVQLVWAFVPMEHVVLSMSGAEGVGGGRCSEPNETRLKTYDECKSYYYWVNGISLDPVARFNAEISFDESL